MTFTLKSSKADVNYIGIKIMVAGNPDNTIYSVIVMRILFRDDL